MGTASSRFESTNWDTVDGGLTESIDGSEPTRAHTVVTLAQKSILSQRYFDIYMEPDTILYTCRAIESTEKWFEIYNGKTKTPLFRVQPIDITRRKWMVYTFAPNWPEQEPEDRVITKIPLAIKKQPPIYRKLRIEITLVIVSASVYAFQSKPRDLRGIRDDSLPLLLVEEINSAQSQYQSFLPQQPNDLIGYWSWEHELTTHKILLHLAKGADIPLHCILAIIGDLNRIDRLDLTVPFYDMSLNASNKNIGMEERTIVVALWQERSKLTEFLEGSDSSIATEVEKVAENAFVVTKGEDGKLVISESKHKTLAQSIAAMLCKMLITVGIFRLHGIVAMYTAAEEIEAGTRDRPKRILKEEDISVLVDYMEEGYSALIASYPENLGPLAKSTFETSGAAMVWYAPEAHVEEVIRRAEV